MKKLSELNKLIIGWAEDKNLVDSDKQKLKLVEELGELSKAILENDQHQIIDGLGDTFVVVCILFHQTNANIPRNFDSVPLMPKGEGIRHFEVISDIISECSKYEIDALNVLMELKFLCDMLNYDIVHCSNVAWNVIKDRKGKTVGGTFIKD